MSTSVPSKRPHAFSKIKIEADKVTEGSAVITQPNGQVFYNPVQQFNRDLSVCVIAAFQKAFLGDSKLKKRNPNKTGITIMEALSATGMRSIRYAKEVPNVEHILANDLDKDAVQLIKQNISNNAVEDKVQANQGDGVAVLHILKSEGKSYDVVDLDPYGSAAPFMDAAIANIHDGGLLCVTCTDTAVLCASYPESCYSKYASIPAKGEVAHEMALRILLSSLEATASRHKKYIVPLISCSIDFYVRVFVRVFESPSESKRSGLKQSLVYRCVGCKTLELQPLMNLHVKGRSEKFSAATIVLEPTCKFCKSRKEIAGPIWNGPIHDVQFINSVLEATKDEQIASNLGTLERIEGMLSVIAEELPYPLYNCLSEASHVMKTSCPPLLTFRSAFLNAGYQVSISHCNPRAIKSNAPNDFYWAVMNKWIRETNALQEEKVSDQIVKNIFSFKATYAANLAKTGGIESFYLASFEVNLEKHPDANPPSRKLGLVRFPENPAPFWGPKARAKSAKAE